MLTSPTVESINSSFPNSDRYVGLAVVNAAAISIKANSLAANSSFETFTLTSKEVVVGIQVFSRRRHGETVVKEVSVASDVVIQIYHFENPCTMRRPRGDDENGFNLDDGHIAHHTLYYILSVVVAGYAHLYSYGASKCTFLKELLGRPILDLRDFNYPNQ
jgi:hypothetical protein